MITGAVNALLEPIVTITVIGPAGEQRRLEAVVDTGYTGLLTLPRTLVQELALPWRGQITVELADGTEVMCDAHDVQVIWDGAARRITCEATDTDPFLGTGLLRGFRLDAEFRPGGRVRIRPIE